MMAMPGLLRNAHSSYTTQIWRHVMMLGTQARPLSLPWYGVVTMNLINANL